MVEVVGISGLIGSGKSYLVNQLEHNNKFVIIRLGKYLRDKCDILSTNDLIEKSCQIKSTLNSGSIIEVFQENIEEAIQNDKIVIIDSIRTKEDALYLRNFLNYEYKLILVLASFQVRKERILKRGRAGDPLIDKEFQRINFSEMKDLLGLPFLEVTDYYINNANDKKKIFEEFVYGILGK